MTYIDPHTKKRFASTNKDPVIVTITNKKYWVVIDNKDNLMYHRDGHLLIFSSKRKALEWFHIYDKKGKNSSWKLEKLSLSITRE